MSKIVSEFEYKQLVTPELINKISADLHKKLKDTFSMVIIREGVVDLFAVQNFIKNYLVSLEYEEVIPSCFGEYAVSFNINTATLDATYNPPYFTKQPKYSPGYIFYTIDVDCSDDLITKYIINKAKQKEDYIQYEVTMSCLKGKEINECVYEIDILYLDKYNTFSDAKKALDSKLDIWLNDSIEDLEETVANKKRTLKYLKEF